MSLILQENNTEQTEFNSNQLSEQDLSNVFNHLKPASQNLLQQSRRQHEKKHKKLKIENEEDDEPSYISFYRYPIRDKNERQNSPLEKTCSTTINKSQRRGSLFNNGLRRSFTPQKSGQKLPQTTQQDDQTNTFQRLQITKISKLFLLKIRQLSQHYNFRHLRKVHFDLIGDVSSSTQYDTVEIVSEPLFYQKQVNKLLSKVIFFLNSRISSNPETKFFFVWNIIFSLAVILFLFYIPFHYSFQIKLPYFEDCILIIFIIKIFLSVIKGYYDNGELVLDIQKIAKSYLKIEFLIDLAIVISTSLDIFLFVCFLRLPLALKTIKGILYQFQLVRRNECIQQIFTLLLTLFLQVQIGGCLFHFVGQSQLQKNPQNNWLYQQGIDQSDWQDRYICSIYYSFTTLMNVIYGDIHAFNHAERITVMFVCLCSYISFGYFVTICGLLLQELAVSIEEFYSKRQIIMNYMIQRSISTPNQIKMMHYLEYMLKKSQVNDDGSEKLLEDVPLSLKNSLYQEFFGSILSQNKYMPNHFSQNFFKELSEEMDEITIQPGKQFIQEGEIQQRVYFLVKGQVEIYIQSKSQANVLQKFTQRGIDICLQSAFTNKPLTYSAKSGTGQELTLAFFQMDKFIEIIKKYPNDFESFCQWRDELILKEHQLTFKCKSCKNIDHELNECPLINLRLSKQRIINQYLFEEFQERVKFKRRIYSNKAIQQYTLVNQKLKQFRIFLTKAVVPQMSQDTENLLLLSDEKFYKAIPPIKIVNFDENMMFEFSQNKGGIDFLEENSFKDNSLQKRVSLEKIAEDSQSSSSTETTSSSDEVPQIRKKSSTHIALSNQSKTKKQLKNQQMKEIIEEQNRQRSSSTLEQAKQLSFEIQSNGFERVGRVKNELLSKQKQNLINMNSILEQKKKINNDPQKPNVPIQGFKKRTDKMSNLYTKMLLREQQKQKRLKYLQLLWIQKQKILQPQINNKQDNNQKTDKGKGDLQISEIELSGLIKKNMIQNLFMLDFDKCQQFNRYNPYYNYDKVIKRFNQFQQQIKFSSFNRQSPSQKSHRKLFLLGQKSQ